MKIIADPENLDKFIITSTICNVKFYLKNVLLFMKAFMLFFGNKMMAFNCRRISNQCGLKTTLIEVNRI